MDYSKLLSFIESVKDKPFKWGSHDCCMFANKCMIAFTGNNFMSEFEGKYHDHESAVNALRKYGENTLHKTMNRKFGDAVHPAFAQQGNVMFMIDKNNGPSLGICMGKISYFVSTDGLTEINTLECVGAWAK